VDRLTAFGLFAVSAMLVCYAFEHRSRWFIMGDDKMSHDGGAP
jgi:hypothetical protein